MMTNFFLVWLGGGAGALARYSLSLLFQAHLPDKNLLFIATLSTNLLGCFLFGLCTQALVQAGSSVNPLKLLLMVGFLGSFTTFSTFAFELFRLFEGGVWSMALLYMCGHLVGGVLMFWLGTLVI